jgi:hypothetical protein
MGFLAGRVEGLDAGTAATVILSGTATVQLRVEANGSFSEKLPPGNYHLSILPAAHAAKTSSFTIVADKATPVVLRTVPLRSPPGYSLDGSRIVLAAPLRLDEKSPLPDRADLATLDELADLLVRDGQRKLHIAVYSEPGAKRGPGQDRRSWTRERADALRQALLDRGAAPEQIEAEGLGGNDPVYPPAGRDRLKNRRVELTLETLPRPAPPRIVVPNSPPPEPDDLPPPPAEPGDAPAAP